MLVRSSHPLPSRLITTDMSILDVRAVTTGSDQPRPTPSSTSRGNPIATDLHDYKLGPMCEGSPCFKDSDCDSWLTCNRFDAHCRSRESTLSLTTGDSGTGVTSLASTTVAAPSSEHTIAIPSPTMTSGPTSTRGDTTLPTLPSPVANSTSIITSTSTSISITTSTSTPTPTPSPAPTSARNRVLIYIAMPLTFVPLLVLALICFIRWSRTHRKPITLDASPAAQTPTRSRLPPAGFGENEGVWTVRGYREYRRSGGTVPSRGRVRVSAGTVTSRRGVQLNRGQKI
ncbi:hypothetical protein PSPO01_08106 [Paraphaeosphaeria sporulosa]